MALVFGSNTLEFWNPANTFSVNVAAAGLTNSYNANFPSGKNGNETIAMLSDLAAPANITQDATHRFVSDSQVSAWNGEPSARDAAIATAVSQLQDSVPSAANTLNKLYTQLQAVVSTLTSNDVNLDTLQELVDAIKSDESTITALTSGKVNVSDIYNALDCMIAGKVLDGRQGKALNDAITTLGTSLTSHTNNTSNPHNVTKAQVGLGNVPNTDATNPANITQDSTHRFTNDTDIYRLANTSGTNTGDETQASIISKVGTGTAAFRPVSDTEKATYGGKQDALTFDTTPTTGSTNPVTSAGVKTYVDNTISSEATTRFTADTSLQNQINTNSSNIATKLTGNAASDTETQITAAVTEDNKFVSRLKLYNWWTWIKMQAISFTGTVKFPNLAGTGTQFITIDTTGQIQAPYSVAPFVIQSSTTQSYLTNTANWNDAGVYSGPALNETQGTIYYDINYLYLMTDSYTPRRISMNTIQHLRGNSTVSTAYGTGAGTLPTSSGTGGNDVATVLSFIAGTSPAANGVIATITFGKAWSANPVPTISAGNAASAALLPNIYITRTTATATVSINGTLTAGTTYLFYLNFAG